MKVIVRGDHPILARVDKIFSNEHDGRAQALVGELTRLGYDNVRIEPFKPVTHHLDVTDDTEMMCAECCSITTRAELTELEGCPSCRSHKVFAIN